MSPKPKNGGAAFATPHQGEPGSSGFVAGQEGMSLRDYFASAALTCSPHSGTPKLAAKVAYETADAMLSARGGQTQ